MFHLLGFLFIIIIAVLVIGLSLVGSVLRTIFGFGRRSSSNNGRTYTSSNNNQQSYTQKGNTEESTVEESNPQKRKKIFTREEGEYVDFEEVKE